MSTARITQFINIRLQINPLVPLIHDHCAQSAAPLRFGAGIPPNIPPVLQFVPHYQTPPRLETAAATGPGKLNQHPEHRSSCLRETAAANGWEAWNFCLELPLHRPLPRERRFAWLSAEPEPEAEAVGNYLFVTSAAAVVADSSLGWELGECRTTVSGLESGWATWRWLIG